MVYLNKPTLPLPIQVPQYSSNRNTYSPFHEFTGPLGNFLLIHFQIHVLTEAILTTLGAKMARQCCNNQQAGHIGYKY